MDFRIYFPNCLTAPGKLIIRIEIYCAIYELNILLLHNLLFCIYKLAILIHYSLI